MQASTGHEPRTKCILGMETHARCRPPLVASGRSVVGSFGRRVIGRSGGVGPAKVKLKKKTEIQNKSKNLKDHSKRTNNE